MTAKETIESLQILLDNNDMFYGEDEKTTKINNIKPTSTFFVLSEAIDCIRDYVIGYHFREGD